jgi:hypothetical protein
VSTAAGRQLDTAPQRRFARIAVCGPTGCLPSIERKTSGTKRPKVQTQSTWSPPRDSEDRKPVGGFWRSTQQQWSDLFDRFLEP